MKNPLKLLGPFISLLLVVGCYCKRTQSESTYSSTSISLPTSITQTYSITIHQIDNATITASHTKAEQGTLITLSISLEKYYFLDYFTCNSAQIDGSTFIMPNNNVTISAVIYFDDCHSIACSYNEYVDFATDIDRARKNELVTIDYFPIYGYALDYFEVNSERIEGTSFLMPDYDVIVVCHERLVNKQSDISITCTNVGREAYDATANWFIEYQENYLHVYAIVEDHFIVDDSSTMRIESLKDNVEILLTPTKFANHSSLSVSNTIDLLMNVSGYTWARIANSDDSFVDDDRVKNGVEFTIENYNYFNKDGMMGYRVDFYISYDIWSWGEEETKSFVICPSLRNCVNAYKNFWDFYRGHGCDEYLNCSKHPLINQDGSLSRNPYYE